MESNVRQYYYLHNLKEVLRKIGNCRNEIGYINGLLTTGYETKEQVLLGGGRASFAWFRKFFFHGKIVGPTRSHFSSMLEGRPLLGFLSEAMRHSAVGDGPKIGVSSSGYVRKILIASRDNVRKGKKVNSHNQTLGGSCATFDVN